MSVGWNICTVNRVMACINTDINVDIGTEIAAYPKVNLTDPVHWNQARFTTSSGALRLRFSFGSPTDASDTDYLVNCLGFVNHNLDGATVTLTYGSTTTYSASTVVTNHPILMDNAASNPDMLHTFYSVERAATYWFLDIINAPVTVAIGQIVIGYAYDLGHPKQGEQYEAIPLHEPLMTAGGYEVPTKVTDPAVTNVAEFIDPETLASTDVYDKSLATAGYPSYHTLERAFNALKMMNHGGATFTGIGAAGGAIPILYHQGEVNGVNYVGRPAHYSYCRARFVRHDLRATKTSLVLSIRDANPRAVDLAPLDGLTVSEASFSIAVGVGVGVDFSMSGPV